MKTYSFPFTAIVGNDDIKLGLIVNAIDPKIGGLLITGPKGIAKSTLVRSMSTILPEIKTVKGCRFHCDPEGNLCDECMERKKYGELPVENMKIKIINLPNSSTLDRVVGSLDIASAVDGKAVLREGLIGEANRGILYIDEVNLLDDSIVDSILDSAASGINIVEREGISYMHPASFILVGTMNPEEGELRPQLLDRFGISVEGKMPDSVETLIEVSNRVESFDCDSKGFVSKYEETDKEIMNKIVAARGIIQNVKISKEYMEFIGKIILENSLSNRAMISTIKTAKAIAAYNKRTEVNSDDVKKALEFALNHRLKEKGKSKPDYNLDNNKKNNDTNNNQRDHEEAPKLDSPDINNNSKNDDNESNESNEHKDVKVNDINIKIKEKIESRKTGRTGTSGEFRHAGRKSGKYLNIRSSLVNTYLSGYTRINSKTIVMNDAYSKGSLPFIIAIDSSRSMNFSSRIEIARQVSEMLLKKLYVIRSRVALISFSGDHSSILMNYTRNFSEIKNMIGNIKSSGKTPLLSAMEDIYRLSVYSKSKTVSLLITDGRGNVFSGGSELSIEKISSKIKKVSRLYIIDSSSNKFLPTYNNIIAEYSGGSLIDKVEDIKLN